jgi:hypothetical protein
MLALPVGPWRTFELEVLLLVSRQPLGTRRRARRSRHCRAARRGEAPALTEIEQQGPGHHLGSNGLDHEKHAKVRPINLTTPLAAAKRVRSPLE